MTTLRPRDGLTRLLTGIVAWRWVILGFYLIAIIPCAYYAAQVGQDSSVDRLISHDDPERQASRAFQDVFGGGEFVMLVVETPDPTALDVLQRIDRFERSIATDLPNRSGAIEVSSVLTIFRETHAGFTPTEAQAHAVAEFVGGTRLFRDQGLIGDEFFGISLILNAADRDQRDALLDTIERSIADAELEAAPIRRLGRVGTPFVNHYFDAATQRSGPRYFGLFGVLVVVLTLALYRSVRTLIAFLATLGVCLAMSVGYIGLTGGTFSLVSPMVPMTILVTATATLVYLHSRFTDRPEGVTIEDHQIFALRNKFLATTASMFAAIVGFAALTVSAIQPVRDMGIWVAVGIFISWVIVFTLFPALQRILSTPTRGERREAAPWFESLAETLPTLTYRFRWPLVLGAVFLIVAGIVSIFGAGPWLAPMKPLTDPVEYVSRNTDLYRDTARARELLPGLSVSNIWLKGEYRVTVTDPPMLLGLDAFQSKLEADPEVGAAIGLPSLVRLMSYAGGGGDAFPREEAQLEESAALLEDLLMRSPQAVSRFIGPSASQTQITVLSNALDHENYERLDEHIRTHWRDAQQAHPALAELELQIVGLGPLQAKVSQSMVPTLVESFALTAGVIFLTFLIVFRSGAARIMTMLPSLFAILVMFLIMRLVGMDLNVATILIASTVLGTSENDQIHFFYHFLEGRESGNVSRALVHTFRISGRAIFFATLINAVGFMAFAVADMRPMQQFGVLTAIALVLAMVADFTVLPAALWIVFRERPDAPAIGDRPSIEPPDA